jgi:vitamin B12 transporter
VQSGYRFPTINELYRDFRVGNALTQANADLQPEESLGVEGSVLYRRGPVTTRAAAFATAWRMRSSTSRSNRPRR